MSGFDAFKRDCENIKDHFPDLTYSEGEGGAQSVDGKLLLRDEDGIYIDHYTVRIVPTNLYPFRFPLVFETSGRIPINFDWHVFEQDGHLCIKAIPEEVLICKKGIELISFINEQLMPYFFNQKFREIHGFFLKERSHGNSGNMEFFKDLFFTTNLKIIAKGMLLVKNKGIPNRVAYCFCGKKLKYRHCHKNAIDTIVQYSSDELDYFLKMVIRTIELNDKLSEYRLKSNYLF